MTRSAVVAAFITAMLGFGTGAYGDGYEGVRATKVLSASTAANGQKLTYLRTDKPEVTALVVEIAPGGETGWHKHAVPVYAYMLAGTIRVEMADGKTYEFKEGEAILEVRDTLHNGRNPGSKPARLVVFYTGEEGTPNVTRDERPMVPSKDNNSGGAQGKGHE